MVVDCIAGVDMLAHHTTAAETEGIAGHMRIVVEDIVAGVATETAGMLVGKEVEARYWGSDAVVPPLHRLEGRCRLLQIHNSARLGKVV